MFDRVLITSLEKPLKLENSYLTKRICDTRDWESDIKNTDKNAFVLTLVESLE